MSSKFISKQKKIPCKTRNRCIA